MEKDELKDLFSKADELFHLGGKMRLTEDIISRCARTSLHRKVGRVRRSVCKTAVLGAVSMLVVGLLFLYVSEISLMEESTFNRLFFDSIRIVRIAMIPFLPTTGADEYISPDCAIPNPLYSKGKECNSCSGIRDVVILSGTPQHAVTDVGYRLILGVDVLSGSASSNQQKGFNFESILVHKKSSTPVSIAELLTVIDDYQSELGNSTVECDPGGSFPVSQLSSSQIDLEEASCVWSSKLDLRVTRVMRRPFPRPSLLPVSTEVALKKTVYIDGPGRGDREIDDGFQDYMHTWYVQAQGERTLEFVPLEDCKGICHRVTALVQAGDSVIFPSNLWSVKVLTHGKEASIGFESYIYL